ncbi:MAG: anti-sigma factor, partial [Edaphobacter sp.]
MSESRQITSEDLALFAMQLLSKGEMDEVAAHVAQSEEARRELAEIQGDLAIYAHTAEMHSPPALARERLLKQVSREKKAIPIDRPAVVETRAPEAAIRTDSVAAEGARGGGQRSTLGLGSGESLVEEMPKQSVVAKLFPWAGWAVAAGLAMGAGNLYYQRGALHGAVVAQASRIDHLTTDVAAARRVMETMTDSSAMRVTLVTKGQSAPLPTG